MTAIVLTAILIPAQPSRLLVVGVGACLGIATGMLQLRAIKDEQTRFVAASTALEVRNAMTAPTSGRLAIYMAWLSGAVLLLCAIFQREGLLLRWIAGYAAFALVRDAIALKGCFTLQQLAREKQRD